MGLGYQDGRKIKSSYRIVISNTHRKRRRSTLQEEEKIVPYEGLLLVLKAATISIPIPKTSPDWQACTAEVQPPFRTLRPDISRTEYPHVLFRGRRDVRCAGRRVLGAAFGSLGFPFPFRRPRCLLRRLGYRLRSVISDIRGRGTLPAGSHDVIPEGEIAEGSAICQSGVATKSSARTHG